MGKKAKEHRKKVSKRNELLNEQKKNKQKTAMDILMNMIRREKEKGAFNGPVMPMPVGTIEEAVNYNQTTTEQISLNGPQI